MLQHEPTSATEPSSPAQNRVTPEELAQALAALETHGEEQAKTIAIGEAVDQLNLQTTPEAIWAEVQAQRREAASVNDTRLPRKTWKNLWLALGLGSLVLFGTIFAVDAVRQTTTPEAPSAAQAAQLAVTPPAPQTVVETLAEVKNDQTFYCDAATANKLLEGKARSPSETLVTAGRPFSSQQEDDNWTFSMHDGSLYLRGYMAPRSPGAMSQGNVPIYTSAVDNTDTGGLCYTQQVTLRVGSFKLSKSSSDSGDGVSGIQEITVSDTHPDMHFKDSW